MSAEKLLLFPYKERIAAVEPAAMSEAVAASYVHLALIEFRELVQQGTIPAHHHQGRKRRIYLRWDLDDYLRGTPRVKMPPGEDPPNSSSERSRD